ncbi:dihydrofolate reductase [Marmoricola sp. URHA0025 HA25]
MGRVVLQMQMSVDGYVDGPPDGPSWEVWDWTGRSTWDAALLADFNRNFDSVSTILLSRPMVEMGYLDHWTGVAERYAGDPDFAFAERIVAARKLVVSSSLESWPAPRTDVTAKDLADVVAGLRSDQGDAMAFGGVGFGRALVEGDLLDELQLYVNPAATGAGEPMFTGAKRLELTGSASYACGIVVNRYRPAGQTAR